jgi:hypothetical protein
MWKYLSCAYLRVNGIMHSRRQRKKDIKEEIPESEKTNDVVSSAMFLSDCK